MKFILKHRTAATLLVAIVLSVAMQASLGSSALAVACDPSTYPGGICPAPANVAVDVPTLIAKITLVINILFTALLLLAVFFIILAAFSYLTAGGDAEKVKKASHRVLYAAVAVAVAVLARAVPVVVQSFLGA